MQTPAIVAALYAAAGVVPGWISFGGRQGQREYRRLSEKLRFIDRVVTRSGAGTRDVAYGREERTGGAGQVRFRPRV